LRYGDWKIVKYGTDEPQKPEDWGLYHLTNDPEEKYDIAGQHPEKLKQLHAIFLEQRAKDKIGS
jgi:arylsulfatase A-like enzyme